MDKPTNTTAPDTTEFLGLKLPAALKARIEKAAKRRMTSSSALVREALVAHLRTGAGGQGKGKQ